VGLADLFGGQSTLGAPGLPGLESGQGSALRTSPAGQVHVVQMLLRDPDGVDLLRELLSRQDQPNEARAVNRYSSAISM